MMLGASLVAPNPIRSRVFTPLSEERCQTNSLRYVLDMVVGPTPLMIPHSDSLANQGTSSVLDPFGTFSCIKQDTSATLLFQNSSLQVSSSPLWARLRNILYARFRFVANNRQRFVD